MERAFWKCQQCGNCCKDLLVDFEHELGGLPLFQSEVQLFPPELIFPGAGQGIKGKARPRPEQVVAYQLDAERCPHLSDDNKCQIYQSRPLFCRSFPFKPAKLLFFGECKIAIDADRKCREHRRLRENRYMITKEHYAALADLAKAIIPIWRASWRFDLRSKHWKPIAPTLMDGEPDPESLPSYAEFAAGGGISVKATIDRMSNASLS